MNKVTLISLLKNSSDGYVIVNAAIEDNEIVSLLFDLTFSLTSALKFKCTKVIRRISEQNPELIYPYFDRVIRMIRQENSFIKLDGIFIMSNLVSVDLLGKFAQIYDEYISLIKDPHMITAANVVGNSWKIVVANPKFETDVTIRLCEVPSVLYLNDN